MESLKNLEILWELNTPAVIQQKKVNEIPAKLLQHCQQNSQGLPRSKAQTPNCFSRNTHSQSQIIVAMDQSYA